MASKLLKREFFAPLTNWNLCKKTNEAETTKVKFPDKKDELMNGD